MTERGTIDASANIELTGDRQLDAYLKSLPVRVTKGGMRKATRQVAKFVWSLAKGYAPERTGALVASLKVRAAPRRRGKPWLVSTSVRTGKSLFSGETFYGGFLEYGTKEREHKSGKKVGKIDRSKWAFLLPALFAYRDSKIQMFVSEMRAWAQSQRDAATR